MFPSFLSLESVEKSLSKLKLQRETRQLVSPFKVDRTGQESYSIPSTLSLYHLLRCQAAIPAFLLKTFTLL